MPKTKKILVAEDEKPLSKALELKLEKEGFDVLIAQNGEEAISLLSKESFDVLILDLIMPKKDGFSVLEYLKAKNKKIRTIVLSNLAQEEDFKKAKDLGAKSYFVKSNTPIIELVNYIKEII
ncbi:MAG: response regulator [Candidatus Paceibacterota bacterium]